MFGIHCHVFLTGRSCPCIRDGLLNLQAEAKLCMFGCLCEVLPYQNARYFDIALHVFTIDFQANCAKHSFSDFRGWKSKGRGSRWTKNANIIFGIFSKFWLIFLKSDDQKLCFRLRVHTITLKLFNELSFHRLVWCWWRPEVADPSNNFWYTNNIFGVWIWEHNKWWSVDNEPCKITSSWISAHLKH